VTITKTSNRISVVHWHGQKTKVRKLSGHWLCLRTYDCKQTNRVLAKKLEQPDRMPVLNVSALVMVKIGTVTQWITILDGPLLDSTSDCGKCNTLFLLCLYLSQGENSYHMIPYHYPRRNSMIWGENTFIKYQKHHHHGGAIQCYSSMAMVNYPIPSW
jgi:hypothetical protein